MAILSKIEISGIEAKDAPRFETMSPKPNVVPFSPGVLNGGNLKSGMPFVISPLALNGSLSPSLRQ